jgi:hypothetical protein
VLSPALRDLRRKAENHTANFAQRELLARALVVEAQPPTDAGRAQRASALTEAQEILDAMSDEARQLYPERVLQEWITQVPLSGG